MFGLSLYRVRGRSMAPTLSPGDILVLRKREPGVGEIAVLRHPRLGTIVKRVMEQGKLSGDGVESTSTAELGNTTDCDVVGTAILAVTPRGFRRLRARHPYSPRA